MESFGAVVGALALVHEVPHALLLFFFPSIRLFGHWFGRVLVGWLFELLIGSFVGSVIGYCR